MTNEDEQRAKFEEMGVEEVRLRVQAPTGFNVENRNLAYKWLTEKEREAKAKQRRTDMITLWAAIVAAAGTVISLGAWLFPRH